MSECIEESKLTYSSPRPTREVYIKGVNTSNNVEMAENTCDNGGVHTCMQAGKQYVWVICMVSGGMRTC